MSSIDVLCKLCFPKDAEELTIAILEARNCSACGATIPGGDGHAVRESVALTAREQLLIAWYKRTPEEWYENDKKVRKECAS